MLVQQIMKNFKSNVEISDQIGYAKSDFIEIFGEIPVAFSKGDRFIIREFPGDMKIFIREKDELVLVIYSIDGMEKCLIANYDNEEIHQSIDIKDMAFIFQNYYDMKSDVRMFYYFISFLQSVKKNKFFLINRDLPLIPVQFEMLDTMEFFKQLKELCPENFQNIHPLENVNTPMTTELEIVLAKCIPMYFSQTPKELMMYFCATQDFQINNIEVSKGDIVTVLKDENVYLLCENMLFSNIESVKLYSFLYDPNLSKDASRQKITTLQSDFLKKCDVLDVPWVDLEKFLKKYTDVVIYMKIHNKHVIYVKVFNETLQNVVIPISDELAKNMQNNGIDFYIIN